MIPFDERTLAPCLPKHLLPSVLGVIMSELAEVQERLDHLRSRCAAPSRRQWGRARAHPRFLLEHPKRWTHA